MIITIIIAITMNTLSEENFLSLGEMLDVETFEMWKKFRRGEIFQYLLWINKLCQIFWYHHFITIWQSYHLDMMIWRSWIWWWLCRPASWWIWWWWWRPASWWSSWWSSLQASPSSAPRGSIGERLFSPNNNHHHHCSHNHHHDNSHALHSACDDWRLGR